VSENDQRAAAPTVDVNDSSLESVPPATRLSEQRQARTSRIDAVKAEVEDAAALRSKMIQAMRHRLQNESHTTATAPGELTKTSAIDEFLEPVEAAGGDRPQDLSRTSLEPAVSTSSRALTTRSRALLLDSHEEPHEPAPPRRPPQAGKLALAPRRPPPQPAPGESEVWDEAMLSTERVERALARLSEALAREEAASLGSSRSSLARANFRTLKIATVFGASFAVGISSLVLAYDWRSGTRFESKLVTIASDLWGSKPHAPPAKPAKVQAPAIKSVPAVKKETAVAKGQTLPAKSVAVVKLEAQDARGKSDTAIPLTIKAVSTAAEPVDLRVAGLPGEAELSAGRRQGDGSWLLEPGQEKGVMLEVPREAAGNLMLTIEAVERSTGDLAAPPREIRVKIDPGEIVVEPAASKITPVSTRREEPVALPVPEPEVAALPVAESDDMAAIEEAAEAPAMAIGIDDPARALMARGDALMELGDVVSARSFYDRAFDLGNARAARSIARTYDPLVLAALKVQGLKADPAKALEWYRKADGEPEVAQAITALEELLDR
jgi:hypothetical protein